ncbi:MAG: site-2 protease family protein [Candidatus Aenigmarchaeota archaeon]|nr:site-2 protease family protein [Candidatus Aenigmarchaeota archaeon]
MEFYTISIIAFIAVLAFIVYKDRKKIERESLLLLRRTERGRDILTGIGRRFPRFWKYLGVIGVFLGFYISISTIVQLIQVAMVSLFTKRVISGVGVLLPSPTAETIIAPGLIAPPFWHWIISVAILMIVHEGFHGIMAAREGIKIKNLGFVLFLFIPGAFVEPDEAQLRRQPAWKQLRVYAAGSLANFITAFIAAIIGILLVSSFYAPSGVAYSGLIEGYPAEYANITGPIIQINSYEIADTDDLANALTEIGINKTITVTTLNKTERLTYTMETAEHPENKAMGFIGISGPSTFMSIVSGFEDYAGLIGFFRTLLVFIGLINFGVGAFNLLPLWITDGARMWEIIFRKVSKKKYKIFLKMFSYAVLLIILFNLFLSIGAGYFGI